MQQQSANRFQLPYNETLLHKMGKAHVTLAWEETKISVLLSLNFVPSLTCPDGFAQFPHFQCHLQQYCACTTLV